MITPGFGIYGKELCQPRNGTVAVQLIEGRSEMSPMVPEATAHLSYQSTRQPEESTLLSAMILRCTIQRDVQLNGSSE
jgi:hypothetical protein